MTIMIVVSAFVLGYAIACAKPYSADTRDVTKRLIDSYTNSVVKHILGETPRACPSGHLHRVAFLYSHFCGWDAPELKPAINWLLAKGWHRTRTTDGQDCYCKEGRTLSVRITNSDTAGRSVEILQHTNQTNSSRAIWIGDRDPAQLLEDMQW